MVSVLRPRYPANGALGDRDDVDRYSDVSAALADRKEKAPRREPRRKRTNINVQIITQPNNNT